MPNDIHTFLWIKQILHQTYPNADLTKGIDFNGDDKITAEEKPEDSNKNGVFDPQEWEKFRLSSPQLKSNWYFQEVEKSKFKWTNPLHDFLSILAGLGHIKDKEIQKIYHQSTEILDLASSNNKNSKLTLNQKLEAVYQAIKEKKMDPDTSNNVFMAVAYEMGWPFSWVMLPDHIPVVRRDDGKTSLEPGALRLSRDEMAAVYLERRGLVKSALKDYTQAIEDFDQVIALNPNFVAEEFTNRGFAKSALTINKLAENKANDEEINQGFNGAIVDFTKAINLKPNFDLAHYDRAITKIITANIAINRLQGTSDDLKKMMAINNNLKGAQDDLQKAKDPKLTSLVGDASKRIEELKTEIEKRTEAIRSQNQTSEPRPR